MDYFENTTIEFVGVTIFVFAGYRFIFDNKRVVKGFTGINNFKTEGDHSGRDMITGIFFGLMGIIFMYGGVMMFIDLLKKMFLK